jgi:hypothetical protein
MRFGLLGGLVRKAPAHDGYEKKIYDLLRTKSASEVSAYCGKRDFTQTEEETLLGLMGAARTRGYGHFKRLLVERAVLLPDTLPFEVRGLPGFDAEESRLLDRMREAAEGRRVVLTGPADYPVGAGQGNWVDSFDWVARINFQWPIPEPLVPDLGRRMDVLYHCCNADYSVDRLFVAGFEKTGFVCMEHQAHSLRLKRRCRAMGIPCLYTTETRARLTRALGHPPSTGLTAVEHLLSLPIRELQLYGITLWHAPYYPGYAGDGARNASGKRAGVRRRVWRHAPRAERKYLLELAARDSRLRVDSTALRLMAGREASG